MHRFRITGVSAGKPNWWKLLSTPPASAVSETNSRNGNVIRSRSVVSANLAGCVDRARREHRRDQSAPKHAQRGDDQQHAAERAGRARDQSFSSSWLRVSLTSVNTGTKAVENEPSANSRRMKFGMRNATQNASVVAFAPNTSAIDHARAPGPRIRETKVVAAEASASSAAGWAGSCAAAGDRGSRTRPWHATPASRLTPVAMNRPSIYASSANRIIPIFFRIRSLEFHLGQHQVRQEARRQSVSTQRQRNASRARCCAPRSRRSQGDRRQGQGRRRSRLQDRRADHGPLRRARPDPQEQGRRATRAA